MLGNSYLGEGVAMGTSRATEDAQETLLSRSLSSPTQHFPCYLCGTGGSDSEARTRFPARPMPSVKADDRVPGELNKSSAE